LLIMSSRPQLLTPAFLAQLERLSIVAKKPVRGWTAGQRRSRRAGNSVEFLDYRPYGVGDDLRYVDWNIYQRTDRLMVKQHVDDEELCLHLLVDASASMGADEEGSGPGKLHWARQLAAALGYVGLTGLERVGLGVMRERVTEGWPPARGRARVIPMFEFLSAVTSGGATRLNESLAEYAGRSRASGVAVLVSDLLDAGGYEFGLKALLERGFEVHVVHVLSPEELQPSLEGDLRLVDQETGEMRPIRVDATLLRDYRERLDVFMAKAETFCRAQGIHYHRADSGMPVEQYVLGPLRGSLLA
jgi:uncharacterized protein (DUF58 family)